MTVKYFLFTFLIFLVACNSFEDKHLKKPKGVPNNSFWAGGVDGGNWFFVKSINSHRNMARIAVYNDQSGELIVDKSFMLVCNADKYTFINDLKEQISGFDGKNIYFIKSDTVSCWLQPVN
jgi:hypothetical protein